MNAALLTATNAAPAFAKVVEILGPAAAAALCEAFGGIELKLRDDDPVLTRAIGQDGIRALRECWGDEVTYIPTQLFSRKARLAEIKRMREAGDTVHEIALTMRTSERNVYRVLAEMNVTSARRKGLNS